MKNYAIIQSGTVVNVIVWDGVTPWTPDAGHTTVDLTGINPQPGIGWTYDGSEFHKPV